MLYVKLYDKDDVEQPSIYVDQKGLRFQSLRSGGCGTASFMLKSDYEDDANIAIGYWIEIYDDSTDPDTLVYSGKIIEPTRDLSADESEKKIVSCMGFAQDLDEILVTISAKNCTVKQAICLLFAQFLPPNVTFNAANVVAMDTVIPGDGYSAEDAPFSQVLTDLCNIQQDINNDPYYWYVGPDKAFRTAAPPASVTKTYSMSTTVGVDGLSQAHTVKESRTGIRNKILVTGGNKANGKPVKVIVQDLVSISTYGPRYTATNITNAVDNGSGLIRITSASHGLSDTDPVEIASVGGTTEANGVWAVSYVDDSTFDLIGSTFANAYTSGGTAAKIGTIQGKISNTRIKDQATLETWGLGQLSRIAYPVITGSIEVTPPGDPSLTGQDYVRISGFTGSPTYHDYHPVSVEHRQEGFNNIITTIQLQNFQPDLFDVFRQSVQRAEALAGDRGDRFNVAFQRGGVFLGGGDAGYSVGDHPAFYQVASHGFETDQTINFSGSFTVEFDLEVRTRAFGYNTPHFLISSDALSIEIEDIDGYWAQLHFSVYHPSSWTEAVWNPSVEGDKCVAGHQHTVRCAFDNATHKLYIYVDGVERASATGDAATSAAGALYLRFGAIDPDAETCVDWLGNIKIEMAFKPGSQPLNPLMVWPFVENSGYVTRTQDGLYTATLDNNDDTSITWRGTLKSALTAATIKLSTGEQKAVAASTLTLADDKINYIFAGSDGAYHSDTTNTYTDTDNEALLGHIVPVIDGCVKGARDLRQVGGVGRDSIYFGSTGIANEVNLSAIPDFSRVVTAAYTATAYDSLILANATGGAFAVTLPTEATSVGKRLTIKKTDSSANAVTISGAGTIDGAASKALSVQYATLTVSCDGANWKIVSEYSAVAVVLPGGSDTQVQFNDGGLLGGNDGLVYDKTNKMLTASNTYPGGNKPQLALNNPNTSGNKRVCHWYNNNGTLKWCVGIDYHQDGDTDEFFIEDAANSKLPIFLRGDTAQVGMFTDSPESTLVVRKDSGGARGAELSLVNGADAQVGSEAAINFGLEESTYGADDCNAQIKARLTNVNGASDIIISLWSGAAFVERFRIKSDGSVGIGASSPSALLHLGAGTATAGTAPMKLTSGTLLSTAEAGAVEFVTDDAYLTITTGAARKKFVLDDGTALTSGRVPVAGTNGRLTDSTGLTYDGSTFKTKDIQPITDDTYYLGKNDDDSPAAYKGLILKDTTNGKYYRVEVINGALTATDLTD